MSCAFRLFDLAVSDGLSLHLQAAGSHGGYRTPDSIEESAIVRPGAAPIDVALGIRGD